ncbi:MAG: hypothetical protein M3R51_09735 [Candidatus Eremiobacteraeota bacterium]|nr:hypothetical protein [Candidatus Eremiobacteraeota bacterium]
MPTLAIARRSPSLRLFTTASFAVCVISIVSGCAGATSSTPSAPSRPYGASIGNESSPLDFSTVLQSPSVTHRPMYIYAGTNAAIDIYKATATGSAKPVGTIMGSNTQLGNVQSLDIPTGGDKLWVNNYAAPGGNIAEFALSARGNTAPLNVISGPATKLNGEGAPYVDAVGNLYSASTVDNAIYYFKPGSSGDVAPTRTISGPATMLNNGDGLRMDPVTHHLFIANLNGNNILAFNSKANGNVAPLSEIGGVTSKVSVPADISFDAQGLLYVANSNYNGSSSPAILVFAKGAKGDVAPVRDITGSNTTLDSPVQIRVDGAGYIYVADRVGIKVFAPKANGNAAPVQSLPGAFSGVAIH